MVEVFRLAVRGSCYDITLNFLLLMEGFISWGSFSLMYVAHYAMY
jgi:hypothetical protein